MNVVQVVHINGYCVSGQRYTYKVPNSIKLEKGDYVRVKDHDGSVKIALCASASHKIDDTDMLHMVSGGKNIRSWVTGVYALLECEPDE